jgi:hypothetical protein
MTIPLFFWFDVEDYITPESDVALGRLVDLFERHSLKATFKMVGEKVRRLKDRGQYETLAKLMAQDIGYHTDYHSKPPSISEYALTSGWKGGIQAFIRREKAGFDTLTTMFGRTPSCYGQPGGSWAPQVYPALRQWGIPTYLDGGPWVNLERRPHRYCDILTILNVSGQMNLGIGSGAEVVEERQARLGELVDQLRHSGGEISLYAHECEFVTSAFWDGVNFRGGVDTPQERWQPAPLLSEAESEARYAAMDRFLTFVQSLPDVEVVTAADAPSLYPDAIRRRTFTPHEIARLAADMADAVTHQAFDGGYLSPGELFSLVIRLLAERVRKGRWPDLVPYRYVDGPTAPPHVEIVTGSVSLDDLFGTALFEDAALDVNGHMPAEIQIGRNWLAPADVLATIGAALPSWLDGSADSASIVRGHFAQAAYVPDHVGWDWIVFPPGFDGDPLLELGKLQAWTLKPAPLRA